MVESKAPETEKEKQKKGGATKPQVPSVATTSRIEASSGTVTDDSESPSPAAKKEKAELLETTDADVEKLKEQLKVEIHGGKQKELTQPPLAPLRPKFRAKKTTLCVWS